jgi:hypothetical protein
MFLEIIMIALLSFFYPESKIDKAYDFDSMGYANEPDRDKAYGDHSFNIEKPMRQEQHTPTKLADLVKN